MDDDVRPDAPARPRVPTAWFVGLAVTLLVSLATRDLAAPLILGGLYLIVTAGWALLRRRSAPARIGRRGAGGVLVLGVVVLLGGGAVAGPPAPDTPPLAAPAPTPAVTPDPAPTAEPDPTQDPEPTESPTSTAAPEPAPAAPDPTAEPETEADPGTALATARELEVKGRAPRTGYDRDLFGSGWVDTDRNGCDTRNDILARDLTAITYRPGTRDCIVTTGVLQDPYSGHTIDFVRGNDTSTAVQIDHVVALSDAWQKGAQQWDGDTRVRFGNDPLNLLAVDGPLNMQKGDGDTATWLPPDRSYRCPYVARQVAVKHAYSLWVTQAEQDAMVRVLSSCPQEPLPAGSGARTVTAGSTEPTPNQAPTQPVAPAAPAGDVYYPDCAAARAAGAAPVHAGEPGYGTHLDRDRDGVGCE